MKVPIGIQPKYPLLQFKTIKQYKSIIHKIKSFLVTCTLYFSVYYSVGTTCTHLQLMWLVLF